MNDPLDRAIAALSDGSEPDWTALEAACADDEQRLLLQSLRDVARIRQGYGAPERLERRSLPFVWGPLQVVEWIAGGAHGDVYRAWDPRLERDVALKLLRATSHGEREATAVAEGRLLARVHHPNVVAVYGADRIDGQAGVWMEYLPGRTLRDEVDVRGPLPVAEAVACAIEVCSALHAVHGAGLIHRDVKAQNIVRTRDGRTVLMDFGAGEDAARRRRDVEGTPIYLAPELLAGSQASARSEVYAVGVLLFFMLTGRYPTPGGSLEEIRRAHARRQRVGEVPKLPASLNAALARALAHRPEDRYSTAEALSAALKQIVEGPTQRRRTAFAAVASVLAALVLCCIAVAARSSEGPESQERGVRRITMPSYFVGFPSHDGRRYAYVDLSGRLWYWSVAGGTSHQVATPAAGETFRSPTMSADGSQVAYAVGLDDGGHELRVTDIARRHTRAVILHETAYTPVPADWSADGGTLLCWLRQPAGTLDLVLVSMDDGAMRLLYSIPGHEPPRATLSPDGQYVGTVRPTQADEQDGQLMLVPTDGSAAQPLLPASSADAFPSWMPDGRGLFFLRRSTTVRLSHDGWVAYLGPDRHPTSVRLVASNVGAMTVPAAYTVNSAGELQAIQSVRAADVYIRAVDLDTGRAGPPTRIDPREIGHHVGPAWSPDGRFIAYFTTGQMPFNGANPLRTLTIKDVGTARVLRLHLPLAFLGGYAPQWCPDSTSLVVWGRDTDDVARSGFYRVDVLSGDTRPLVIVGDNDVPPRFQCAPDGRHFLFADDRAGIVSLDLASGQRSTVLRATGSGDIGRFLVSPSGDAIALVIPSRGGSEPRTVALWRDGSLTPLMQVPASGWFTLHAWTPDGSGLLYSQGPLTTELDPVYFLPLGGGPARRLGLSIGRLPNPLSLSPDGRYAAYAENTERAELLVVPLASR